MEHLSMFACFQNKEERDKFYQNNVKPFSGVDKPIFSVSLEDESCSTQGLLEAKELLKVALPFLEDARSSISIFVSVLSPKDERIARKKSEIKDIDKLINQIKAKLKD